MPRGDSEGDPGGQSTTELHNEAAGETRGITCEVQRPAPPIASQSVRAASVPWSNHAGRQHHGTTVVAA
eukprot:163628-Lingulodinium_polyedra.AAC.1